MSAETDRQLQQIIDETKDPKDLSSMAASMLEAWCGRQGTDKQSVATFLTDFFEAQFDDDIRNTLITALQAYQAPDWAED